MKETEREPMARIRNQWISRARPAQSFPPYRLADRGFVEATEVKTQKLARIYHVAQNNSWNGREVLAELVDKHGGIHVPPEMRKPLARISSILLWGELAAWSISADIALHLTDTDAKMAASSQVFDEARHFYVLRDYLWQADIDVPPLGGWSRQVLVNLLETESLVYKLVGMQLMVETVAVVIFRSIANARIEPVLADLMPYYERDEARHVGLGVLALPTILADMTPREARKLWFYQTRINLMMLGGGLTIRRDLERLGIDQKAMQLHAFRIQAQAYREMREAKGRRSGTRGLFRLSRDGQQRLNAFLFPEAAGNPSKWQRRVLAGLVRTAEGLDRWMARRGPDVSAL